MSNVVLILTKANVAKSRIDNVLNIVPSTEINIESIIPEIKEESLLKFDNVNLRFEEDGNNALKNISFALSINSFLYSHNLFIFYLNFNF